MGRGEVEEGRGSQEFFVRQSFERKRSTILKGCRENEDSIFGEGVRVEDRMGGGVVPVVEGNGKVLRG
jgi:hypothetical protein